ncbi:hypothetical protein RchiOBHm_Chr1g0322291 [Rosa chinensis]|uniref:Transmembrane protein n=1 Tax=Rosa chinensis TaxID=74649 RepID=A0A2P6S986_ROSCH|nr:hypothetical protein RchiOBHm_Chr1g0322291 [Rosa chinensis]
MVCCLLPNVNRFFFRLTLMLTGLVVLILVAPHLAILCILVPTSSLGVLKGLGSWSCGGSGVVKDTKSSGDEWECTCNALKGK